MNDNISSKEQAFVIFDWWLYRESEDYADMVDAQITARRYKHWGTTGMVQVR